MWIREVKKMNDTPAESKKSGRAQTVNTDQPSTTRMFESSVNRVQLKVKKLEANDMAEKPTQPERVPVKNATMPDSASAISHELKAKKITQDGNDELKTIAVITEEPKTKESLDSTRGAAISDTPIPPEETALPIQPITTIESQADEKSLLPVSPDGVRFPIIKCRATDFLLPNSSNKEIPAPRNSANLVSFSSLTSTTIRKNAVTHCVAICVSGSYAGQRCWKKLSRQCRNEAADQTAIIRAQHSKGIVYEGDLAKLAANLLCTKAKHHRRQAAETAQRWREELEASLEAEDYSDEEEGEVIGLHSEAEILLPSIEADERDDNAENGNGQNDPVYVSGENGQDRDSDGGSEQRNYLLQTPRRDARCRSSTPRSSVSSVFTHQGSSNVSTPASSPPPTARYRSPVEEASPTKRVTDTRRLRSLNSSASSNPSQPTKHQEETGGKTKLALPPSPYKSPDPQCEFSPYSSRSQTPDFHVEEIKGLLARDTTRTDCPGFVYVVERRSSPGYIKIGSTVRLVEARLAEHRSWCSYGSLILHYQTPKKTLWNRRLESLVHTELAAYRRVEDLCSQGKGCGSTGHREWFEFSGPAAGSIVERWRTWLEMDTYEPVIDRHGTTVKHRLGEKWDDMLDTLLYVKGQSWEDTWNGWVSSVVERGRQEVERLQRRQRQADEAEERQQRAQHQAEERQRAECAEKNQAEKQKAEDEESARLLADEGRRNTDLALKLADEDAANADKKEPVVREVEIEPTPADKSEDPFEHVGVTESSDDIFAPIRVKNEMGSLLNDSEAHASTTITVAA